MHGSRKEHDEEERQAAERLLRVLLLPQRDMLVSVGRGVLVVACAAGVFLGGGRDVLLLALAGLALALALFGFARQLTPLLARDWSPLALAAALATNGASELYGEVSWQRRAVRQTFFRGGAELPEQALLTSVPLRRAGEVLAEMLDVPQRTLLRDDGIVHVRDFATPFGCLQLRLVDRGEAGSLRVRAVLEPTASA